jgi:succinate-semialdehyde dehydrogenase / glutarate-semialdehyde dehydrogenase
MPAVFRSVFPFTQQTVGEYPLMDEAAVNQSITEAEKGFERWRNWRVTQRAAVMSRVAALIRSEKETIARLITLEMGKITAEALAEAEKCALACDYYAQHAEVFLTTTPQDTGAHKSWVSYQPLGAVLGIMPWNFPFWQVFRYAIPTLMAGNVSLLKHASNVCGCAKKIETLFAEAGAPVGVFKSLIADTDIVEKLLQVNIVQGLTLTGSEKAGSAAAVLAARHIKKQVLELGGSDACIILPDADIKKAATTALQSRLQNAGQSCIAAKRFIVLKDAADSFIQHLLDGIGHYRQGNPFDAATSIGPLARIDLAEKLQQQLQQSVQKGAQLLHGGAFNGCNAAATLVTNVKPGTAAFDEETFGPLAAVTVAATEQEAISLANSSAYGLGAAVWTKDVEKGIALSQKIESGSVFINSMVRSDPRLPFGGIKKSGYGRELGPQGMLEFVNTKTIVAEI